MPHLFLIAKHLLSAMSVILILVFFLSKTEVFKNMMVRGKTTLREKVFLIGFFGFIGVLGTYSGIPVENTIANTRAVGVIVGGLVAGPMVGLGSGLVAGLHRFTLGGYTVVASSMSTVIEGLIAGMLYNKLKYQKTMWPNAMFISLILEILHMGGLVLFSRPFVQALRSVEAIGPPMILINTFGAAALMAILESVYHDHKRIEGSAAQLALQIANKTLPHLRKGLYRESAENTAKIIFDMVDGLGAVAITTPINILAFVGTGSDHHSPETDIFTRSTRDVIDTGEYAVVQVKERIGCPIPTCPLSSKVTVPLKENNKVVGSLVLYKLSENSITPFEIELSLGLAQLFSNQIEISRVEHQSQLLAQAEIRALQAQINPHFLFNALNTIVYYCRTDPVMARDLLIHLGEFYRENLVEMDKMIHLDAEIKHIDSYVKIEMARFRNKLQVKYDISPACKCRIPPLVLQPIVENAIKHGILPKKEGGTITVTGQVLEGKAVITVDDDGVGMENSSIDRHLDIANPDSNHIGLINVKSRLKSIFQDDCEMKIESWPGRGTRVRIALPLSKEGDYYDKGSIGR